MEGYEDITNALSPDEVTQFFDYLHSVFDSWTSGDFCKPPITVICTHNKSDNEKE